VYKTAWNAANPDKVARYLANGEARRQRYELRRRAERAGQDPDLIEAYAAQHDGRCEICGRTPGPHERGLYIDHNHRTGAFRGLICNNCNAGLGRFMDSPALLAAAAAYLSYRVTPLDLALLLVAKGVTP